MGELQAEVFRLTTSFFGHGWRRHDRRCLSLRKGDLHIFDKGSSSRVKAVVSIAHDVENCAMISGNVLSIQLQRRSPSVASRTSAEEDEYLATQKVYFFEFASADDAAAFHDEISRLRLPARRGRGSDPQ